MSYSLIIQGPILSKSFDSTSNIHKIIDENKHLFDEIILSTWDSEPKLKINGVGEVYSKLNAELKKDTDINSIKLHNRNKQAYSSYAGINISKSEYCLKVRTDQYLDISSIINWHKKKCTNHNKLFFPYFISHTPFQCCDFYILGSTKRMKSFYQNILKHKNIIFRHDDRLSEMDQLLKDLFEIENNIPKILNFPIIEKFSNSSIHKKYPNIFFKYWKYVLENYYGMLEKKVLKNFYWRGENVTDRFLSDKTKVFYEDEENYIKNDYKKSFLYDESEFYDFLYFFQIEKYLSLTGAKNSWLYRQEFNLKNNPIFSNIK